MNVSMSLELLQQPGVIAAINSSDDDVVDTNTYVCIEYWYLMDDDTWELVPNHYVIDPSEYASWVTCPGFVA